MIKPRKQTKTRGVAGSMLLTALIDSRVKALLISVSVILCVAASSKAQGWRGIRPLHATREEVERLIGPSMQSKGITYDLKNERVNVIYSEGSCAKGWPYGWNVKPGTVIAITIYPQQRPKTCRAGNRH